MATTDRHHTAGIMPAVNDLAAALAIAGAYLVRIGTLAEGTGAPLLLQLTTDFLLPLLGGLWLLGVPVAQVCRRLW